jgi:hypothetical protein
VCTIVSSSNGQHTNSKKTSWELWMKCHHVLIEENPLVISKSHFLSWTEKPV